jgi:gliding motility-associated protein GldC
MPRPAKTSKVAFWVHLDERNVPEAIEWEATDAPEPGRQSASATILSIWDPNDKSALRIDLWTKEMPVQEMSEFYYQTLLTMADSYLNATGNGAAAGALKRFAEEFMRRAAAEG